MIEELSEEIERLRGEQHKTLTELNSRGPGICPNEHENLQSQFMTLKEENASELPWMTFLKFIFKALLITSIYNIIIGNRLIG